LGDQERDVAEGADMIMVKPGTPYLDIVRDAATLVQPIAALVPRVLSAADNNTHTPCLS